MPDVLEFDLVILGTGSGNSLIVPQMDGWRIAIIERDVFGGTCMNRGCIPSKMLIYAADVADTIRHASKYGVHAHVRRGRLAGDPRPGVQPHRPDRRRRAAVPPQPRQRRRVRGRRPLRRRANPRGQRRSSAWPAGGHRRRGSPVHPRDPRPDRRPVPHQRHGDARRPAARAPHRPRRRVHRRRARLRVPLARLEGDDDQPQQPPAAWPRTTTSPRRFTETGPRPVRRGRARRDHRPGGARRGWRRRPRAHRRRRARRSRATCCSSPPGGGPTATSSTATAAGIEVER